MIERYCTLKECRDTGKCAAHEGGRCVYEYVAADYEESMRWLGNDPPPRRWWAGGTLVYRSMADFYDD